eukprot:4286924-Prymnesium_polylepis.1
MSSQGKMVGSKRTSQDHQEDPSQVHKKAKKDFRVNAMKFWMTWSALADNEITKEDVLSFFQGKCKVKEYSIG